MPRNEVRIIGGLWKGRKLIVPANAAVRPSLGRVRETLFNWLAGDIENSDCLDLFAGSGALGFEALSRGARSAVLVDNNRNTAEVLKKNARRLGAANCTVRRQSALSFLKGTAAKQGPNAGAAQSGDPGGTAAPGGNPAARGNSTPAFDRRSMWDIVFLDPPFASTLLQAALDALRSCDSLRSGARIYVELDRRGQIDAEGFRILKEATAGDTRFGLLASP